MSPIAFTLHKDLCCFACWEGKNGVIVTILFFNLKKKCFSYLELKKLYFKDIVFILCFCHEWKDLQIDVT